MTAMMDKKGPKGMALMVGMGMKPKMDDSSVSKAADDAAPDAEMDSDDDDAGGDDESEYSIPVPDGFEPPDDVQEGEPFDATIRCHMEDDKLMIDSINGIKTSDSPDKEGSEEDDNTAPQEEEGSQPPKTLDEAMKAHNKSHGMMG